MGKNSFDEMIIDFNNIENTEKIEILNRDELLLTLDRLKTMTVGRSDRLFCNSFISEIVRLLINSIFLYEKGYFDCAFYSIRQAAEVGNNMLFIANKGESELIKWNGKKYFPSNRKLLKQLSEIDEFYSEVKNKASDFFETQDNLIKKSHKIIHKQGFDTFYSLRKDYMYSKKFNKQDEIVFFLEVLNHTICTAIVLYIIVDPVSLILADEELTMHFNFNPMAEPADIDFLEKYSSVDIVRIIKSTKYFKGFSEFFKAKEKMLPAVYDVVRNQAFNLDYLEDIKSQKHLISLNEKIILELLLAEIKLTNIYPNCSFEWYFTSIKSRCNQYKWSLSEHKRYLNYKEKFNLPFHNIFRSIVKGLDDNWILEHNERLTENEIKTIKKVFNKYIKEYQNLLSDWNF